MQEGYAMPRRYVPKPQVPKATQKKGRNQRATPEEEKQPAKKGRGRRQKGGGCCRVLLISGQRLTTFDH